MNVKEKITKEIKLFASVYFNKMYCYFIMYLKELKQLRGFDDEISKDIMCLTNMLVMC
jgi:hypothetical protein